MLNLFLKAGGCTNNKSLKRTEQHFLTFISFSADAELVTSSVDVPAINETNTLDEEEDWPEPPIVVPFPDTEFDALVESTDPPPFTDPELDTLVEPADPPLKRDDWQVERAAPAAQLPLDCFTPMIALSTYIASGKTRR